MISKLISDYFLKLVGAYLTLEQKQYSLILMWNVHFIKLLNDCLEAKLILFLNISELFIVKFNLFKLG